MSERSRDEEFSQTFEYACTLDASVVERLKLVADAARKWSPAYGQAVDELTERIRQSGACERSPSVGDRMPTFMLPDDSGRLVSLDSLIEKGPVAIVFHRGSWCPFCRLNTIALTEVHDEIKALGGSLVAVTPDRRQFTAAQRAELNVPFPILTDMDNGYAASLNLAIWLGEKIYDICVEANPGDPRFEAGEASVLPIPATFVVGRDGIVRARFVDPDYRKRMDLADLLDALRLAQ